MHLNSQLSPRLQWHPDVSLECAIVTFNNCFCILITLSYSQGYSGIQMYRRSVPLLPLTINCFYILTLSYPQGYSGIQMYRRSVPLLPLTIVFVF